MTMAEFRMHRPGMAKTLERFVGPKRVVESIMPEYENDELFSACVIDEDGSARKIAVCVKSTHWRALSEEEAPGCPTWWWEDDL